MMRLILKTSGLLGFVLLTACVAAPKDYTNFRAHPPRSILVLPPLNESTDMKGTYGYLSTVTAPLAEMGFYVYPVAVIDSFMKENGMANAGEMHQVPLKKVREIIGADAVLYVTLKRYGASFQVVNSVTAVSADARLVDVRTGTLLWTGKLYADDAQSNNQSSLAAMLVTAVVKQVASDVTDNAHQYARMANQGFMTPGQGLLYGPYHPKYENKKP